MPQTIELDGVPYRVVGFLDDGYQLAVMDPDEIGRVLIRDTLDGPWRRWGEADRELAAAQAKAKAKAQAAMGERRGE